MADVPHADRDSGREIALRDEVLELLYWLEGEGFAADATISGMTRFLALSEAEIGAVLAELAARGDLVETAGGTYRLTADGRREAARRFADDFAPLLHHGHGECNDPSCDCHADDPDTLRECRGRAAQPPHRT